MKEIAFWLGATICIGGSSFVPEKVDSVATGVFSDVDPFN
jgi:hypothetical protein